MTDAELIARLRDEHVAASRTEAADRIEALIAERDALFRRATLAEEWRDHDKTRAEAAEAKLAKAVEALEVYACGPECADGKCYDTGDSCGQFATATLAELKGENHE